MYIVLSNNQILRLDKFCAATFPMVVKASVVIKVDLVLLYQNVSSGSYNTYLAVVMYMIVTNSDAVASADSAAMVPADFVVFNQPVATERAGIVHRVNG